MHMYVPIPILLMRVCICAYPHPLIISSNYSKGMSIDIYVYILIRIISTFIIEKWKRCGSHICDEITCGIVNFAIDGTTKVILVTVE